MPRQPVSELPDAEAKRLVDSLSALDITPLPPAEQLALIRTLRERSPETAAAVDQSLLSQIARQRQGLAEAREHLRQLGDVLDKLSFKPWHPAIFLGSFDSDHGPAALVANQAGQRVVGLGDEVDVADLAVGDEVLLGSDQNVIMRKSTVPITRTSETAEFQRLLGGGRLVIRHRDEELIVRAADTLDTAGLTTGEQVRWERGAGLAFERLARRADSALFVEDTPQESFSRIGGLDAQIARLQRSLRLHMLFPEIATRYGVRRAASVLLVGPPGTGKTMMARALANWLAQHAPSGRSRFMAIKPGELHSMWYGQSEANYREAFRAARQAGDEDPTTPVVMFFDEVDAVAGARGQSLARVDDRVLTSFMAELDGFKARGNVWLVSATNRRDALDPAVARPGRLGDLIIDIPRPGQGAAAAVFDKHLPPEVPCAAIDGRDVTAIRQYLLDVAVSRLYAPNGEGDVASIMFRDGTRRAVRARDLMSGAHIANIARSAVERACLRDIEGGAPGVAVGDILEAISEELASAVSALTPANCHGYVSDLPQDLAVVRIEPIAKRVPRPHRFVNVA
jgi:proteasome-associated ATPase